MVDRRYLIAGGAGYFGARLAEALSADAMVTITRRSLPPHRAAWIERTGIEAVAFDSARDSEFPTHDRFDAVINLAMPGAADVSRDAAAGRAQAHVTAKACLRLLDAGRATRLIHISTFHVYGGAGRASYDEMDTPVPVTPYGQLHLEIERMVLEDRRAVALRPSNMVGAPAHADLGDQARLLFLDLCRQAARGRITLHNDGLSYRDFVPFVDAIAAVRLLLDCDLDGYRLFNVARGEALRLDAAAALIREVAGVAPAVEFGDGQDAYRVPFTVNVDRLNSRGWQPRGSLAREVADTVRFFRECA